MNTLERNAIFIKNTLIIIGAGGHGKVVADIAIKMNKWSSIAFLDDDASIRESMGVKVIGTIDEAFTYAGEADFFVAIGNNKMREAIQERLIGEGLKVTSLIHPHAVIGTDVEIGIGSAVMAGVVINSSSRIGKGCIINTSASLDHDNHMEDYVHISPGVHTAGGVSIGKGTWAGIGSTINNNVRICSGCIIGAGAAVVRDVAEPGVYAGVPARRMG